MSANDELQEHISEDVDAFGIGKGRAYISGPMRGIEDFNYPAFNKVAEQLRGDGWIVHNPAESFDGATDREWHEYMREDIGLLLDATDVFYLPGWQNSQGALLEYQVAKALGLGAHFVDGAVESEPVELEAQRLVRSGERQAQYGHPSEDFARTAQQWGMHPIGVAIRMIQLKLSRLMSRGWHRDSVVDTIGYAICMQRLEED